MALMNNRRSKRDEMVIDPFNAPDPVMPHDEPDLVGIYDPVVTSEEGNAKTFQPSKKPSKTSRTSHNRKVGTQTDTHTWHETTYSAPEYTAPEAQPTPTPTNSPSFTPPKQSRHKRRTRQTQGNKRRRLIFVVIFLIVVGQCLSIVTSCIDSLSSRLSERDDTDYYSSYLYTDPFEELDYSYNLEPGNATIDPSLSWYDNKQTIENLGTDVLINEMDKISAGTAPYSEQAAAVFSSELSYASGFTLEDIGLDSQKVASDMTSQITYDVSSVSLYSPEDETSQDRYDTEGVIFFYVDCPDIDSIAWDLASYINYDLELESGDTLDEKDLELIAEEYNRLVAETSPRERFLMTDISVSVAPGGSDVSVILDESSWDNTVRDILDA